MFRKCLLVVAALSPWFLRRLLLRALCGARFGMGARVGFSYVDTQLLELGAGASIGSLNVIRHVREVRLGDGAMLGNLNSASGFSPLTGIDENGYYRSGRLLIGSGGAITNRHYLDLHADIEVGRMALVAGVRSTLFTHSIDLALNRQATAAIHVGDCTFVGTNSVLLPGTHIADKCAVAAGAVVTGRLEEPGCLYGGVPARKLKAMPDGAAFFSRTDATVK
jgi:acetyltransferase-like isoleucine patch superfamily enzyme